MDFDRMMADLFAHEDQARAMAQRLMDLARASAPAAAAERESLLAFIRGPLERHMKYEEDVLFPRLVERGLAPEVQVAQKHHANLRESTAALADPSPGVDVAAAVFLAARLMLHHTNFEGDYIYPELGVDEWRELMRETTPPG